jgi:hypothetical protein
MSPSRKGFGSTSLSQHSAAFRPDGSQRAGGTRRVSRFAIALLLVSACASKVSYPPTDSVVVDPTVGLSVVFFPDRAPGTRQGLGDDAADCVWSAIADGVPRARLIPLAQFQRGVFPDVPLEALPLSHESLTVLSKDEAFRGRVQATGIRYLVTVGGGTDQPRPWGDGVCGGGPGGAGCVGFWLWKRDSTLWAEIVDLASGEPVAKVEAAVSGRPWFMVLGIFPLGAPSFTETWACHKLGQGVAEFLTSRQHASP